MSMQKLPLYLLEKLSQAELLDFKVSSERDILRLFAQLKLYYPSLTMRGLNDLYKYFNNEYPDINKQQSLLIEYRQLPPIYLPRASDEILYYMQEAFALAECAYNLNEVPVGAIVVYGDKIIGRGYNQAMLGHSSLLHAEIIALEEAQSYLVDSNYLTECDVFVTLEPCLMCSGAIMNSRIKRLYYAAREPKTGACHSQYRVFYNGRVNHHTEVIDGVMSRQSSELLQKFFSQARLG